MHHIVLVANVLDHIMKIFRIRNVRCISQQFLITFCESPRTGIQELKKKEEEKEASFAFCCGLFHAKQSQWCDRDQDSG